MNPAQMCALCVRTERQVSRLLGNRPCSSRRAARCRGFSGHDCRARLESMLDGLLPRSWPGRLSLPICAAERAVQCRGASGALLVCFVAWRRRADTALLRRRGPSSWRFQALLAAEAQIRLPHFRISGMFSDADIHIGPFRKTRAQLFPEAAAPSGAPRGNDEHAKNILRTGVPAGGSKIHVEVVFI